MNLMSDIGILRRIDNSEVELMRAWRNAPGVRENMYTTHIISEEEHRAWWDRLATRKDQQYFMYEYTGVPSGIVGFTAIDLKSKNCSWAFYAAPEAPKGTGSRMEFLALDHAFNELKLCKIHCEVLAFNKPVIKLHEKFGFQVEGVFRQHHLTAEGYVDIFRLGMLAEEWAAKRDELQEKITFTNRA